MRSLFGAVTVMLMIFFNYIEISSCMSRREDKGKSVQYADETKGEGEKSEEEPILSKQMDEWGKIRLFDERTREFVDDKRTKLRIGHDDSSPRVSQTNDGRTVRVRIQQFHKLGTSERDLEFSHQIVQPDVANHKNKSGRPPRSAPQLDPIPPISWTLPIDASGITRPYDFQTGLDVHGLHESKKLSDEHAGPRIGGDDSVERVTHKKKIHRRQDTPRLIKKLDYGLSLQLGPPESNPKTDVPSLNPLLPVEWSMIPDERRYTKPYDYQTGHFIDKHDQHKVHEYGRFDQESALPIQMTHLQVSNQISDQHAKRRVRGDDSSERGTNKIHARPHLRPFEKYRSYKDTQALLPKIEEAGGYQANLWNTPVYQQSIPHPGQAFVAGYDLNHFHQGQQGLYQGTPLPPPGINFHGQIPFVAGYHNQGQQGKYEDTPQPAPQDQFPGQYTHYPYYPGPPGPPGCGHQQ